MRIGIEASCWANPRGYGRYTRGLLTALLARSSADHFILFVDSQTRATCAMPDGVEYVVVPTQQSPTEAASADGSRSLRDLWAMSAAVAQTPLDVLFFPTVFTYFPVMTRAAILVDIHDIIAETYPTLVFPNPRQRWLWRIKSWLARRQARLIVTVSDHAKAGIARYFGRPLDQIAVVGEAPDPVFRPISDPAVIRRTLTGIGLAHVERYLICLGGLNPHKNLGMLFEVLAALKADSTLAGVQLLLVGPAESDTFTAGAGDARQMVQQLGLQEIVHFTCFLPDEATAHLLGGALALVMPSLDEGYGLGAVEAAACGTPVIATQSSPLPQLLAGGGWFIDPQQPATLRAALVEMLGDEAERQQRGQRALACAQALTWQHSAEQFEGILNTLRPDPVIKRGD